MRRHLARACFWGAQIPPAVWIHLEKPTWREGMVAYLIFISQAALVESALTDYFTAKRAD
jgi:hypothetical protein